MKSLIEEKAKRLAESVGWSFARAHGYFAGEWVRLTLDKPSEFALVATDDHSKGYRDGYFDRILPVRKCHPIWRNRTGLLSVLPAKNKVK